MTKKPTNKYCLFVFGGKGVNFLFIKKHKTRQNSSAKTPALL